ncbi:sigma-54 dependent transcriptional regulator, partial [uncultured Muribaculum sp.]
MGSVTETLFESELFGHVKGAFTNASADRAGKFEAADGSTLFMDEIGNLPPYLQSKLLTVIQNRKIVRVGSNKPVDVDIRLICATNCDLQAMVADGRFRQDLLYRINTIHLEIPPLRQRKDDIVPLAEMFMKRFSEKYKREASELDGSARDKLMSHYWPGNIRELEHAVEKAVIISDGPVLRASHFELPKVEASVPGDVAGATLEDMERQMITAAVNDCHGNLSAVASRLGITRQTLYNKMKKFGL